MKVFEVVFNESEDRGVYALSCVENPAMEDTWLKLSEHPKEIQFSAVDEEKRLLLGAALIPNKKVYRNIGGNEFYIVFGEDTIERVAHSFLKNGFQNNSSENHEIKLDGVSVVQSWVVDDPERDKSAAYGKKYEKGTWVTMMKVDNEDAWEKAKKGELNGFSIDGLFSLKEVSLNNHMMSDKKSFKDAFKEALQEIGLGKQEVKMGQLKLKDGKTKIEFEGDAPEIEKPVFLVLEDGEKERVPEGEHELENGEILHVDANGLVAEAPKEEPENVEEVKEAVMEMARMLKSFKTEMAEIKKGFESKLEAEKKKNEQLEAKLEKEPAEAKITRQDVKDFEPKNMAERFALAIQQAKN